MRAVIAWLGVTATEVVIVVLTALTINLLVRGWREVPRCREDKAAAEYRTLDGDYTTDKGGK